MASSIPLPQSPPDNLPPAALQLQPHAVVSTPSTHLEIPGAYPHETSSPSSKQNASETSRGQSYFPNKPATYLLGSKRTSLPSADKEGVLPGEHYDGVGPLPGSISETSVAKLPDERLQSALEVDQSTGKHVVGTGSTSLPSQGTKGVQPYEHNDGAGPLPGSSSEAPVAELPDERVGATSEDISGVGGDTRSQEPASGAIAPPENRDSAPYSALGIANPETQVQSIDPQGPVSRQEVQEGDANVEEVVPKSREEVVVKESVFEKEDERKGENDDSVEESPSPKQEATPPSQSAGSTTQRKGKPGRSSSDSDAGHRKRASVMNMLKGEMKVLLGKASRNMGKVEEGEKLKHGSD